MGRPSMQFQCSKGHEIFLAYYRNSAINKRIKGLFYCPECKKFFKDPRPCLIPVDVTALEVSEIV